MRHFLLLMLLLSFVSGCRILRPDLMFKTKPGYAYSQFKDSAYLQKELIISVDDAMQIQLYTNDGFKLIDLSTISEENRNVSQSNIHIVVEHDGKAKFPLLGRINIAGMTIRQAELFLEEKYGAYYNKPFAIITVANRRVTVYPGRGGTAKVVKLDNNTTTIVEALALAGGIMSEGKAYKIKLIRGDLRNPEVYLIDVSTIEGVKKANLIVKANDIIYVEPRIHYATEVLTEISPILSLFSTILIIYGLFIKK